MATGNLNALRARVSELELQLEEAQQALEAIRTGQVESLVIEGPDGPCIYSLEWATYSYRVLVEAMSEGAATMGDNGVVLYCNARLAEMLRAPLEQVMGNPLRNWIPERWQPTFDALLARASDGDGRGELCLLTTGDVEVPIYLSVSAIHDDGRRVFCLVLTDLRAQKRDMKLVELTPRAKKRR